MPFQEDSWWLFSSKFPIDLTFINKSSKAKPFKCHGDGKGSSVVNFYELIWIKNQVEFIEMT